MTKSAEITESKSLKEKLEDVVKESIGDLMTADEIRPIIEKGITDTFFGEQKVVVRSTTTWNMEPITRTEESLVTRLIRDSIEKKVQAMVIVWMAEHKHQMESMIQEEIDKGIQERLMQGISSALSGPLDYFKFQVQEELVKTMNGNGTYYPTFT